MEGWICPKCGSIWAPSVLTCQNCISDPTIPKVDVPPNPDGTYKSIDLGSELANALLRRAEDAEAELTRCRELIAQLESA